MKNKLKILLAFGIIVLFMSLVWIFAYRPTFSTSTFSSDNTDWGGFGDFFWGFGVMCFTALNVYVFWQIEQQMRRERFVSDLRNLTEKIREAQSTKDEKVIIGRIESFKFAVASTIESGLLSNDAKKCVRRLLTHLQPEQILFDTAPYFCEAIIYTISIDKSIDNIANKSRSETSFDLGLLEKLNLWDKKTKEEVEQRSNTLQKVKEEFAFEDYLHREFQAAKRLSRLFPKAKIYPQVQIPNTNLVIDALIIEKGKNDIIVEFKSECTPDSVRKAIRQLNQYKEAYKKAYSRDVDLVIMFEGDIERERSVLSPDIMIELRHQNIRIMSFPIDI